MIRLSTVPKCARSRRRAPFVCVQKLLHVKHPKIGLEQFDESRVQTLLFTVFVKLNVFTHIVECHHRCSGNYIARDRRALIRLCCVDKCQRMVDPGDPRSPV